MNMVELLNLKIFGNTVLSYIKSFSIFLVLTFLIWALLRIVNAALEKIKDLKDNVSVRLFLFFLRRFSIFLYLFSFFLSLEVLELGSLKQTLHSIDRGLLAISIVYILISLIDFVSSEALLKVLDESQKRLLRVLTLTIKVVVLLLGLVFVVKNFVPTFEITSILTTFGVSGVILGLGLQHILQDVLNYFAIVFDRPFVEGEYILFGDYQGTVSKIGLRSTRLVSLSGEEINVPNSVITSQVIKNYSRLSVRRVQTKVSIPFSVELEKLHKVPHILKKAVLSVPNTTFAFGRLSSFGSYSYDFMLAYYINERDFNRFMEIQEAVNFAITEELNKEGITLSYPIQVVKFDGSPKNCS